MNIPESQRRLYLQLDKAKQALKTAIERNDQIKINDLSKKIEEIAEKIAGDNAKRKWFGR